MARYDDNDTVTVTDDRVVRDHHNNNWSDTLARTLAALALLLSLGALILAWTAYNRTGEDLEDRIQRGVNEATTRTIDTTQEAADSAADAVDAGPDGVDEDDTDTAPVQ